MDSPRIVIDTNVWVSAFRSKRGASRRLIDLVLDGQIRPYVGVSLLVEYQKVFRREHEPMGLADEEATNLVSVIASLSRRQEVYFLWRTFVDDPDDAHVFELAVAAQADHLVTFNKSDFPHADEFGIRLSTPYELLSFIGVL